MTAIVCDDYDRIAKGAVKPERHPGVSIRAMTGHALASVVVAGDVCSQIPRQKELDLAAEEGSKLVGCAGTIGTVLFTTEWCWAVLWAAPFRGDGLL